MVNLILLCLFLERQGYIRVLEETQPLSMTEVQKVFSSSSTYIIPYDQCNAKKWALVLYNTVERKDSEKEASEVETNLRNADFNVMKMKWENALDLPGILHGQLTGIRESTSVLFVCIMSHGNCGTLRGDNNSLMPISDILFTLTDKLPPTLPLVKVITAVTHYN